MNNRMRNKQEKKKRQAVNEIFDLALQVNGLTDRRQKVTGNLPTVFVWFAGHVSKLNVQVYVNGWERNVGPQKEFTIHTDSFKLYKELAECKNFLIWLCDEVKNKDA